MNSFTEIANLLLPDVNLLPDDIYREFPPRKRNASAKVTRFAPSPTGFLTIGGLYATFISERLAHQSEGVFYLRIEDTDKKREVGGSTADIVQSLQYIGIRTDEGVGTDGETGDYGPYTQSSRTSIYKVFVKHLLNQGLAYPCFCEEVELQMIRDTQQAEKTTPGYYGKWAKHRNFTLEQIKQEIAQGKTYVIRLKSPGSAARRIKYRDLIKGDIEMPENDQDIVIMKSDGIPTYHFAHVIDDFLMGTTHVIRADEWIASVPIHLQLFEMLGFRRPEYGHLAPLMKMEGNSKRKFSKRKDKDAAVQYYREQGYPGLAVSEYFMTLVNSNFEEWRRSHLTEPYSSFTVDMNKMNASGPLFDLDKLNDIGKNVIAGWTAEEVYSQACNWAEVHDNELYNQLIQDKDYSIRIFNIGRTSAKPRKDIAKWSDVRSVIDYFFDELFVHAVLDERGALTISADEAKNLVQRYQHLYNTGDDRNTWFDKIKKMSEERGYPDVKTYKNSPDQYKGHTGDVAMVLRIALTGRAHTPDLFDIMQAMGEDRVRARLKRFVE